MSVQQLLNLDPASLNISGAGIMYLMSTQTKGERGNTNEKRRNETKWMSNKEQSSAEDFFRGKRDMGEGRNRFKDKLFEIKQQAKCKYLSSDGYHIFIIPTAIYNSCLCSESLLI